MTYCLAIKTEEGLVLASDSRTNAGVDQINQYSKMHTFSLENERVFVLLSAGNLATTQAVIHQIQFDLNDPQAEENLFKAEHMFDAAHYVGEISKKVQAKHGGDDKQESPTFGATFILGGQIKNQETELYMIYPEGNCIVVSKEKPFLQIGETKYGKPILDRLVTPQLSFQDAARCALISIDSTIRSNLSVGFPVDLLIYIKDSFNLDHCTQFREDSEQYLKLTKAWSEGIKSLFSKLPEIDW